MRDRCLVGRVLLLLLLLLLLDEAEADADEPASERSEESLLKGLKRREEADREEGAGVSWAEVDEEEGGVCSSSSGAEDASSLSDGGVRLWDAAHDSGRSVERAGGRRSLAESLELAWPISRGL